VSQQIPTRRPTKPHIAPTRIVRRAFGHFLLTLCVGLFTATFALEGHAQGITSTSIAIGVSSPQTGSESSVGIDYLAGAQLAFDDLNKNGGVFGRSVRLTVLDDAGKADATAANTKKLIAEGVFALFGFYGGNNTLAALPAINEARIPLVGVFTGNQSLRDPPNRYIFHARTGYYAEIAHVAKRLTAMSADRVAVVEMDDRGGKDSGERTAAEFRKLNVKVPAVIGIERGTTKVEAAAAALAKADVQWVVMILTNKTAAALIQRTRELGGFYQFMSLSFTNAAALIKDLGPRATGLAFAQVVPFPMSDASSKLVSEFRTLAGNRVPVNYVSMEGFVTAKVMIEGLRRAGRDPTREKFITGLESGRLIEFDNYSLRFSPSDRTGGQFVELTVVDRSGKLIR
jgi:branched-chain amino acid transport system substrate-binding protein